MSQWGVTISKSIAALPAIILLVLQLWEIREIPSDLLVGGGKLKVCENIFYLKRKSVNIYLHVIQT